MKETLCFATLSLSSRAFPGIGGLDLRAIGMENQAENKPAVKSMDEGDVNHRWPNLRKLGFR